jgi:MoaA/NifB/PqqE/SkfB family radical SAM enzyme
LTVRVLLINPPIRLPRSFAHYPMFSSLGLLTAAGWLRARDDVAIVDAFTLAPRLALRDDGPGGFRHVGAEVEALARAARARVGDDGDGLCVVVAVTMFSDLNRLHETLVPQTVAALARALPHATIGLADLHVCGMNYFPYDVAATLRRVPEAAFALVGEAEPTLPALIERLETGASLEGLPRLGWRDRGGEPRWDPTAPEPLRDLDALPLPAFDLIDMDAYFLVLGDAIEADLVHEYHVRERQLPLMTSRGCPFRCRFCTNQVLALPWRAHSVEWVRRAVRELRARWRPDRLMLLDDNINVDRRRFGDLVAMLAEEGMAWDAVNGFRADRLDRDAVRAIRTAGNTKITVSAESGDPDLLRDRIGKGLKLSSVVSLARVCQEERVPLQVHYIVGVPGETKAQINRTLEFATELLERHGAWPLLQHAIPFPGTRMYRDCEEAGWFVAPPESISGAVLEEESIVRTPELDPGEIVAMKRAAQHLHAAIQRLHHLEIETRCDSRCLTCHCAPGPEAPTAPTREELRAQMAQARFMGGAELLLGGGEPTLRPDLEEVVRDARGSGFERVRLVTNAHGLAARDRARRLVAAGVSGLVVDLHGPDATLHDAVARTPGAFALTLAGVRQAQRAGCADTELVVSVTRSGLERLPATVRLAARLGSGTVHLRLPPPGAAAAAAGEVPTWATARPWLLRALDAGTAQGSVTIQGMPLCLLPERPGALAPAPPWVLRRARRSRARLPACRGCVVALLCGGFLRPELAPLYGAEPTGRHAGFSK